jgi:hypothetical protein
MFKRCWRPLSFLISVCIVALAARVVLPRMGLLGGLLPAPYDPVELLFT